ncbi:MAG: helix-turn-helix domain-containing protein [Burkholderiales bacterium]|nr:helix-turn-helix domain-containing protein [Burkholderiales bacterium]
MEVARVPQQAFTVVEGGSPGQMLKAARERMGLTIGDVCANLKMLETQIKAMESDTLKGLPPGGYGRAFIKGYARFVGLDADAIVESMMSMSGTASTLMPPPQLMVSPAVAAQRAMDEAGESDDPFARPTPVSSSYNFGQISSTNGASESNTVKYCLIALVIGLVAYIVVPTFKDGRGKEEPSVSQIPQEMVIPAVNAELMPSSKGINSGASSAEPAFPPGTVLMAPQSAIEAQSAAPMSAAPAASAVVAAPVTQAAPVQPVATLPPQSVVRPAPVSPVAQSKPVAALAPAAPAASAASGVQRVRIQFTDRAYVTIRDRDGNVLMAQLNPANTDKLVEGNPPFKVIIGNARAVKIEYQGKPLDVSSYTKDDVARFVIE